MRKHLTKKEQQEHLEKWKESGLSKNAYALKTGLNPRTFIDWTWQKAVKKEKGLVEIPKKMFIGTARDIVIEKGEITVRMPAFAGETELRKVFCALGGLR